MKVSIIVPIYKVEKYLRRCIDSILAQTFTDFELILIDDESPDNCPNICDFYANQDARIKVVHKKNGGVSAARNTGLDVAMGDYIAFVDGDDFVLSNWLIQLVQAQEDYKADWVLSGFMSVNEEGTFKPQKTDVMAIKEYSLSTNQEKLNYYFNNIYGNDYHGWAVWTRLFSRSIIEQYNIRFPLTCENFAEDLCFVLIYVLYSKKLVKIENAKEYCYCIHESSMMQKSKNIIKLNAVNEVSVIFGVRYLKELSQYKKEFYALHFLIMNNQYEKLVRNSSLKELKKKASEIVNIKWYKKYNKKLIMLYSTLKHYYGQVDATHWTCRAFYIKWGNWFFYKFALWIGKHFWIDKRHLFQRLWCKVTRKKYNK